MPSSDWRCPLAYELVRTYVGALPLLEQSDMRC